ncbi:hypothetical protein niasHS_013692 [Heterodera schachtii]|uniref:JmjC domain-containing protein n=1 Tax=Heterodera schachtii TaxID=97005 RepID=A0ABD2IE92_HETSC
MIYKFKKEFGLSKNQNSCKEAKTQVIREKINDFKTNDQINAQLKISEEIDEHLDVSRTIKINWTRELRSLGIDEFAPISINEGRYPKRSCSQKVQETTIEQTDLVQETTVKPTEKPTSLPYPVEEYLKDNEFAHDDQILQLPINEFTTEYLTKFGLVHPILFKESPEKLGMRMPNPKEFSIMNVLDLVGDTRQIEVFDVYTQKGKNMRLKDFVKYFNQRPSKRKNLLNSLSLEFSDTKLSEMVTAPAFVRDLDWIDNVWPSELLARQKNLKQSAWAQKNEFSIYPKVQKYCIMSVKKCFTDFHIDFGGTSVWYHVLKGEKVFWLIEPTEDNLKLYEKWMLAGNDDTRFLGKLTKCTRVRLRQGQTMIIPAGWIHSVYTPVDSLVFGGNFLHNYSIPMQIHISHLEDRIQREKKYRFPHFNQIFWCFIAQIVQKATHRMYQRKLSSEAHNINGSTTISSGNKNHRNSASTSNKNDDEMMEKSQTFARSSLSNWLNAQLENEAIISEKVTPKSQNNDQKSQSKQTSQINADGYEICYDELLGNAIDGSYTNNPIQSIYDNEDKAKFTPTKNYDINFLYSLPPLVINGLFPLLKYAEHLLKLTHPEVIEGITRPHHLVKEFRALLNKIKKLGLRDQKI